MHINSQTEFKEERYRWVILGIAVCVMLLNGLLNNIIIPIANKLSVIYDKSERIINIPTILSFLVFSIINIPVNHFLDRRGIKNGYLIGLSLYATGMFLTCLVNKFFPLLIVGYIIFSFGQPFILNLPAKISTYWFLPENVNFLLDRDPLPLLCWSAQELSEPDSDSLFPLLQCMRKVQEKVPKIKYFHFTLATLSLPVSS
jgi:hypothetical protein